jgi:hypothetical protein
MINEYESFLGNTFCNVESVAKCFDVGGIFDIANKNKILKIGEHNFKYKATGLQRLCFSSPDLKFVAKIPKSDTCQFIENGKFEVVSLDLMHNIHEYLSYIEAPEILKPHIAKCELLPNGILLQEYVKVEKISGAYREIGYRESDGKYVVFDCDCFLSACCEKPKNGYNYSDIFINLSHLFPIDVVNFAKNIKNV